MTSLPWLYLDVHVHHLTCISSSVYSICLVKLPLTKPMHGCWSALLKGIRMLYYEKGPVSVALRQPTSKWKDEMRVRTLTKQSCQVGPMNIGCNQAVQTKGKALALLQLNAWHFG